MSEYAEIKIGVTHNNLHVVSNNFATSGAVNSIYVRYEFRSAEWSSLTKQAVFSRDGNTYKVNLNEDNGCFVPEEVLISEGAFFVGVCGEANNIRLPSEYIKILVKRGSYSHNPVPTSPTHDGVNAFFASLNNGVYGVPADINDGEYATAIINVTHNTLSLYKGAIFTAGALNSLCVKFVFETDEWEPLSKIVSFIANGTSYIVIPDDNGLCYVPHEVLDNNREFQCGICGVGQDILLPTNTLCFKIINGAVIDGEIPGGTSISGIAELLEAIASKQDILIPGEHITIENNVISVSGLAPVALSGDAEDLTWPDPLILYCGTASEVV